MNISFEKFEEHIFLNTVLIINLTDGEAGTGFLVAKKVSDEKTKILLISNKHVFWGKKDKDTLGIQKKLRFTLHIKTATGEFTPGSTKTFDLDLTREQNGYFDHPDATVDVGCLNVSSLWNSDAIHASALDLDTKLCNYQYDQINSGQSIYFIGYPSGFYDRKHSLPILRTGIIASIPKLDFDGRPCILVDAPVFGGSSGSPVFVIHNGQYQLLGIISEAIYKKLDFLSFGAPSNTNTEPGVVINLGIVFKIETIKEVVSLAGKSA